MTLFEEANQYKNEANYHKETVRRFIEYVNATPELKAHRDFIEEHYLGFGERSFQWLWKLIVDELPQDFRFLEIGVYCGQILSLVKLLAPHAAVYGITPLSTTSGPKGEFPQFPNVDYHERIQFLHNHFNLPMPTLLIGESTKVHILDRARILAPFDCIYVDGGHEYDVVAHDLRSYPPLVKDGGFLVVDDASCFLNMYTGSFPGITQVSRAVRDIIEPDLQWKHLLAVMHNRVWQKIL